MGLGKGEPQAPRVYKKSAGVHAAELKARGFRCQLCTIKKWLYRGMPEDEPDRTQWILSNCSKRPQPVKTKTSTVNTEVVATYRQETDNLEYSRGREIPNDPYERLVFWRADEAETKAAEAKVRLDRTRGRLIETKVVHGLMKRYTSTAIQILEHVATEVATQFPDPPELERQIERAISDRVNGAAMAIAKLWDDIIKEFDAG